MNPLSLAAWLAAFFLCANLFSHTVALRLLLLLPSIGLVSAALWKDRSLKALPRIWVPFLAWGVWAALSISWSLEPARSAKEFQNEIVYGLLALWTCFVAGQAANAARVMLPIAAAGAGLVCFVSLYYFAGGLEYFRGWHGGAGNHSSALLTMMPCALLAAWCAARSSWSPVLRALPGCLVGLFLLSAYATLNRTVWIGYAVQFLVIGAWFIKRRAIVDLKPLTRQTRIAAAVMVLAIIAGAGAMLLQTQNVRSMLDQGAELKNDPRFALWLAIVDRIEERPAIGYGFGRGMFRGVLREELDNLSLWHSHNLLLDVVLQLGIPGLVLLLVLLGATVREGWGAAYDRSDVTAACGIALVAVVAGMLVRNTTDVLWERQNALLFWSVTGILLAWSSKYRAGPAR